MEKEDDYENPANAENDTSYQDDNDNVPFNLTVEHQSKILEKEHDLSAADKLQVIYSVFKIYFNTLLRLMKFLVHMTHVCFFIASYVYIVFSLTLIIV